MNPFEFQIYDWNSYHEIINDEEEYVIQIFGRTEDNKDVCLKVNGFTPFFYVKIPETWTELQLNKLVETVKSKVSYFTKKSPYYDTDLGNSLKSFRIVNKHQYFNFSNKKLFKFAMLIFNSYNGMRAYSTIFSKPLKIFGLSKDAILYKRYESNIEPHLRMIHINNLISCGWVSIDKKKLKHIPEYSNCDHSYSINWRDVKPSDNNNRMAPFKIMGYDIECISGDENFPQAERKTDKIIQIGMTIYQYGSMKCDEQHILTLKQCSKIKGANVECYQTEKELLKGWARKVRELRPDIKTGYHNCGFDDKYIYDRINRIDKIRAKKLGIPVAQLENKLIDQILKIMGKVNNEILLEDEIIKKSLTTFKVNTLSSSALGDNILEFFNIPGIITVDMLKVIQRDHKLTSYKLDSVSAEFISEEIIKIVEHDDESDMINVNIYTKSTKALEHDSYIQIMIKDGYSLLPLKEGVKYYVSDIETVESHQVIKVKMQDDELTLLKEHLDNSLIKVTWTFAKDDMHHTLINKYFNEQNPKKIRQVAKYCLKDCKLVNLLLAKLDTIANSVGMANVCHVPLSYLFFRGQGVKIFSLVSKKCMEKNYLIEFLNKSDMDNEEKYEGATVIEPIPAVYEDPIGVLDYNSLYPNSMRGSNLSGECSIKKVIIDGVLQHDPKHNNLEGYIYHDIYINKKENGKYVRDENNQIVQEHNRFAQEIISEEQINEEMKEIFDKIDHDTNEKIQLINQEKLSKKELASKIEEEMSINKKKKELEKSKKYNVVNGQTVRYGILPEILTELLNKRKETNARLAQEKDPFVRTILNALQLAFKVTANSLYGQTGATTSPIYFRQIAACTTSIGRSALYFAKKLVETNFKGAKVIYGDTDSIFINFNATDENGNKLKDREALIKTMELAPQAAALINKNVPSPQMIVFEKIYWPFILVTKKKYVGLQYSNNPDKYFLSSMGIVLKRRDNAPIVKIVIGGIIDCLLKHRNIGMAVKYTEEVLAKLMNGHYHMDIFTISKGLKSFYKKPETSAHKVLADRMAERDPGNRPRAGDRIPYVYIVKPPKRKSKKKELQGNLIETPSYVIENDLKIDYLHYLENQIMKPASQILELMISPKEVNKLFNRFIIEEQNRRNKSQSMEKWMGVTVPNEPIKLTKDPVVLKPKYENISYIGNTKRLENRSMDRWLKDATNNDDDWD